jgi:MFS family permease
MRAGNIIGPVLYVLITTRNDVRDSFAIYLVCAVVAFAWLVVARDRSDHAGRLGGAQRVTVLHVLRNNRRGFATSGIGALGISLMRGSRTAIIPLWAAHIGLSSSDAASIFAYSSIVDLTLFYPAGVMSDRYGRRSVAVPCAVILAVGHVLVPFSHSYWTLFLVAFVIGLGNGFGAGIVLTLGADLAPEVGRASFLAVWGASADAGSAAGPLVDSAVVALGAVTFAGPVVGALGLITAAVIARSVAEPPAVLEARAARAARPREAPREVAHELAREIVREVAGEAPGELSAKAPGAVAGEPPGRVAGEAPGRAPSDLHHE